ncbi:MAG TPA: shikimate kinase [Steroidobacteraceae bacterium]|nr:shikimate kinase [Steroidobacteraceae bacterium]
MLGKHNIYLIGPMGTGKTAVGRQLARMLDQPFVDSDAEIEHHAGVDIPYIFEREGEAGFRQREREVLADLCQREGIVLATGGGAVLAPDNRRLLHETGVVVHLQTSLAQQLQRVGKGRGRPLLKGSDVAQRLTELRAAREPLYQEIADITLGTDNRRVPRVAELILEELGRQAAG